MLSVRIFFVNHPVQHSPQRPHIRLMGNFATVRESNFGRCGVPTSVISGETGVVIHTALRQSEISQFEDTFVLDKNVLGLYIVVHNLLLPQFIIPLQYLHKVEPDFFLVVLPINPEG